MGWWIIFIFNFSLKIFAFLAGRILTLRRFWPPAYLIPETMTIVLFTPNPILDPHQNLYRALTAFWDKWQKHSSWLHFGHQTTSQIYFFMILAFLVPLDMINIIGFFLMTLILGLCRVKFSNPWWDLVMLVIMALISPRGTPQASGRSKIMKNDSFEILVFGPKCTGQKYIGPKYFRAEVFPGRSILGPKYFRAEVFSGPKYSPGQSVFGPKYFRAEVFRAEVFPGRSECRAKVVPGPKWVWAATV